MVSLTPAASVQMFTRIFISSHKWNTLTLCTKKQQNVNSNNSSQKQMPPLFSLNMHHPSCMFHQFILLAGVKRFSAVYTQRWKHKNLNWPIRIWLLEEKSCVRFLGKIRPHQWKKYLFSKKYFLFFLSIFVYVCCACAQP